MHYHLVKLAYEILIALPVDAGPAWRLCRFTIVYRRFPPAASYLDFKLCYYFLNFNKEGQRIRYSRMS